MESKVTLSPEKYDAVIFDLDGVITQTADVHAVAWKRMFDAFLKERQEKFVPFDATKDYLQYVDGKPRYDGIQSFLQSRKIDLPWGNPDDEPNKLTICGLANKKNAMFRKELDEHGIKVYKSTVDLIKNLHRHYIKTAVISSSKNCTPILEKVDLLKLFEAKVDGIESEKRNIPGKPEPDIFLEAARDLGVKPEKSVVVEDAISGVQAGKKGNFGLVIGVDRGGNAQALKENGADVVVDDLIEVGVESDTKPNALDHFEQIKKQLKSHQPAFFLDYDGTLTPIVRHPTLAKISNDMRDTVQHLGKKIPIAVISGRDREDVENMAQIPGIFYAGSHGFDIAGPDHQHFENTDAEAFLPDLKEAENELRPKIDQIEGAWVERKKYAITVHYREAKPEDAPTVENILDTIHQKYPKLRKSSGKKVHELLPQMDWDKGKALHWLLKVLKLDRPNVIPFYLGDDTTDEDAFKAIKGHGIGIAVQETPKKTAADYILKDPDQVQNFFEKMLGDDKND